MISLDLWQRMTPKQQWETFNALQNEQALKRQMEAVAERVLHETLKVAARPSSDIEPRRREPAAEPEIIND